ncbi:glycosyltransferase family 39 protein [Candidatus Nephthysia bennettiae]
MVDVDLSTARRVGLPGLMRRMGEAIGTALRPSALALIPILAMQASIALTTLHNSAFQDEGLYLYAGRQIFRHLTGGPPPLEQYAFYFSGYPYLYPVLGGVLDMLGGLELARAFSLLCMLGVTALAYACTRTLFSPLAAVFASATFAFLGVVLFLSRLATYDAPCILLLALATLVAYRAGFARGPWLVPLVGPLLVLAILVKYAAMLFVPSALGLVVFGSLASRGWLRAAVRLPVAVLSLAGSLAVAYHFMDRAAFHGITGSTTNRASIYPKPRLEMVVHALYMGGAVWVVALIGLVLVFKTLPRYRLLALTALGSSTLTPAYHIYKEETISFDKHIAFSLFFALPLAGYAMVWLAGGLRRPLSGARLPRLSSPPENFGLAGVAVVLIVLTLGMRQSQNIYAGWGNSSALSTVLHTQLRDGSGRYFAEDIEFTRYDARDISEAWQWTNPYYFDYVTPRTQQHLFGRRALEQAIDDQYFSIVELSFVYAPDEAFFLAGRMAASHNYDLIARVPYEGQLVDGGPFGNRYGSGYYYVWRSALTPGTGSFTDLSQLGMKLH